MEPETEPKPEHFDPKHDPVFEFKLEMQQNVTKTNTLYVGLYGPAGIYLEACMRPEEKVGHLNFQRAKQIALGNIYLHNNSLYVIFTDALKSMHEYYFAEFLAKNFEYQSLVVVDARQVTLLQGDDKALSLRVPSLLCSTSKPQRGLRSRWECYSGRMSLGSRPT